MKKKIIFSTIFILFLGLFSAWQGIYLAKNSASIEEKLFLIEKGQNLFQIAENLEKKGLIKNKFFFDFYIFIKGTQRKLQAGEYYLSPSENVPTIAKKIISGEVAKIVVTIPEGWTQKQIEEKLGFKLPGENLEGFLFPDTYQFSYGASAEEIVRKMLDNFDKKLAPYQNEISGAGLTLFDVITMASLLEKEVKTKEDKEVASGILWKRLKNGIPLQVDATITYIIKTTDPEGVASRPYGARISVEETKIDSPYNTYKYKGLPLGPICNPGLESILAAMYPKGSEYWYYLSTPEGETIFSETLDKHNLAKARYLKL